MDHFEEANVRNVGAFIKENGIQCDLRSVEAVDIAEDEETLEYLVDNLKEREENMGTSAIKYSVWNQEECKDLQCPTAVGAVAFPAYVMNPYKFVCTLLEMSISKGLNLQTNTPVLKISKETVDGNWTVVTERGDIEAENVILATNAYTSALYPPLKDFITPVRGQIAAVRSGSKIAGNPALKRTCQLMSGEYMQTRQEPFTGAGDLIIGGGRGYSSTREYNMTDDSTIHPKISAHLSRIVPRRFFGEKGWGEDAGVVMEWTGIMGYTEDGQPVIGQAPGEEGLWVCAGFHGHGMATTFQSAEALVGLMTGKSEEVGKWLPECYRIERVPGVNQKA
ncbi:Glycine oxidase [Lachnellula suecica]|uniref:Glycine oxidase n=1 Tax=Lachnellula suecica TaxID=602035 RepID=A0A8T9CM93_9HELO|nr:Glycine oxidase [Lachnellula suecica]